MNQPLSIGVVADFNAQNLVSILKKQTAALGATVHAAPFGQVLQTLADPGAPFWEQSYDAVIVWTFPTSVSASFSHVIDVKSWPADDVYRDVDVFADHIRRIGERAASVFVPTWVEPVFGGHRASLQMKRGLGMATALMGMNMRVAEALGADANVVLFNAERWLRAAGPGAYNHKLWFLSKTPFSNAVFEEAADDVIATLRALRGLSKKVVIVDLDNTLWGGIVGEIGWEAIRLGGHDPVGEAFVEFQKALKRLSDSGVVLGIASKNEESIALEAIEKHPEMVLRPGDFAGWRINWGDKAQNIAELVSELNVGLDSVVFIDDTPHERGQVRELLPDVLVPELSGDPLDLPREFAALRCFESASISSEDRARTKMYVADRERKGLMANVPSVIDWLRQLQLEVEVNPLSAANIERAVQLLNKTNQMNLATRRLSVRELQEWASRPNHQVWTFRVRDKFGDYGLCGIASLSVEGHRAELVDFLLSCRAMGRRVEEAIISIVAAKAREAGAARLHACCVPTKKNTPCLRWFQEQAIFQKHNDGTFLLDIARDTPTPEHIRITQAAC
jgi:FkbH-like protein